MNWRTQKNWLTGELVVAAHENSFIRDALNILKTFQDGSSRHLLQLKGYAYGAGGASAGVNANAAGGSDTLLTGYQTALPEGLFSQPGDALVVEGTLSLAANTNSKTAKIRIAAPGTGGSAGAVTFLVDAANVANHIVPFRLILSRDSASAIEEYGLAWPGAASGGNPTTYLSKGAMAGLTLSGALALEVFLASSGAGDIFLTDFSVEMYLGALGATV